MPPLAGRRSLVFDGDCSFCTTCAAWLTRRLAEDVAVVPWQRADLTALGLTAERAQHEVLWVDRAGVRGGGRAVAAALQACRGGWRIAGAALGLPPLRWLAQPAYGLVARNRHRLPGGTPACRM
jgi:predicted DCC family thiol-disulfide oxidoreductase YuxK